MSKAWMALLLAGSLLAGCSSKATPPDEVDLGLRATPTSGVIRGLVVDAAIRPLEGVRVVLPDAGDRATETNENGLFGFEGVAPGSHFLKVSKAGYADMQQSTQVEAGVDNPPLVKVQMTAVSGLAPYVQVFKWDGFLECALSVIALCGAFNGPACPQACTPNVTDDQFTSLVPVEKPPQLVQSEVVWQTTTAASDQLWLWHSRGDIKDGSYNGSCNCWAQGKSPLLMKTNESVAAAQHYGTHNQVYLRMFTGSIEGTRNPLNPEGCYPGSPGPNTYCGGLGFSVEQDFTVFTHVFYGYLPTPGWRFSEQSEPPAPPA
ncbi:MAG TPA: carboxypeptidase-like regulatory domain-containing protein [Candidatus Thermoplasmatota archaeon]|nr:carboxypeptidase-like regulatory domain-containing protein [Candidatus Thermoplasmatota archaeon]